MTTAGSAPGGGKLVAWLGFGFGSVMSIAANVLYTWLPAAQMPPGWSPPIAAQVGAAVWPIGLLISVEVLARVAWPSGWPWLLARYGGAGTVAVGSAVISYGHLSGVLAAWGYGPVGSAVGPLVLDGLMVVSGFALLAMGEHRQAMVVPQTVVRETAPRPAPETAPVRKPAPAVRPQKADRPVHGDDEALVDRLRELADRTGRTPSARTVRAELSVGANRARRLLEKLDQQEAA